MHRKSVHSMGQLLLWALLVMGAVGLLRTPSATAETVRDAVTLCTEVLIPSLFPFLVLSSLAIESGGARELGVLLAPAARRLFRLSAHGTAVLVLGFLGGYPVGAKALRDSYASGFLSETEANRLILFCNNCGPAFLLGTAGCGVFGDGTLGILLLGVHILSALLIGFFLRPAQVPLAPPRADHGALPFSAALPRAVSGSLRAMGTICAYVVLFRVVLSLLSGPLPLHAVGRSILGGLLECSTGVCALPVSEYPRLSLILCAVFTGWGGCAVLGQTASMLEGSGLSLSAALRGKVLHGAVSGAVMGLIVFANEAPLLWGMMPMVLLFPIFLQKTGGKTAKRRV